MAERIRTLVVDDEPGIRLFIEKTLQRQGHQVKTVATGQEALDVLREQSFDLVMLDLKLGGSVDGLKVLELLRWRWPETAAIILTAHGTLESAMTAIEDGVDRYLLKPVTPQELREAVSEALVERQERQERAAADEAAAETVVVEPFEINVDQYTVIRDGELLDVTPSEFKLLLHLMRNVHRVVPPPELVEVVRDYHPEDIIEARNIIKWYIYRLRRSVEPDPEHPQYILNVRGVGYRFGPPGGT